MIDIRSIAKGTTEVFISHRTRKRYIRSYCAIQCAFSCKYPFSFSLLGILALLLIPVSSTSCRILRFFRDSHGAGSLPGSLTQGM